jgi:hypothetical protein
LQDGFGFSLDVKGNPKKHMALSFKAWPMKFLGARLCILTRGSLGLVPATRSAWSTSPAACLSGPKKLEVAID